MRTLQAIFSVLVAVVLLAGLPGCEKEGPAERAGKAIDEAVEDAGEALEDAGEAIEDKQEEIEDEMEKDKKEK